MHLRRVPEERSIVKIRYEGFSRDESSHLADHRTFIATGRTPASLPTCFRDRTTVKSILSLRVFILSFPSLFLSCSIVFRFPSFLSHSVSLSVSAIQRRFKCPLLFLVSRFPQTLLSLPRPFAYFSSRERVCQVTPKTGIVFHVGKRVLSKHHDSHHCRARTHCIPPRIARIYLSAVLACSTIQTLTASRIAFAHTNRHKNDGEKTLDTRQPLKTQ